MKPAFYFAIFISTLLSGCQYDPFAGDLTTHHPKTADITGTYVFEKQTVVPNLNTEQINNSAITLYGDSTFKLNNIPNVIGGPEFEFKGNTSATGK